MIPARAVIHNARIVSCEPTATGTPRRGATMRELRVLERGHVVVEGGRIVHVGAAPEPSAGSGRAGAGASAGSEWRIDARGRVLLPAPIDCHTHACWAGERWGEWEQKRAGTPYLEILKQGGGIMATVRAVREAGVAQLTEDLRRRVASMRACGTGAVEVKTGYGLDAATELKMLEAICAVRDEGAEAARAADAAGGTPVLTPAPPPIVPTLLAGHAIDPDNPRQLQEMLDLLPRAAARVPSIAVDAFCEEGAWSVEMCRALFVRARELGLPIRVHVDQFNALGGLELALEQGARSVDHLEASTPEGLRTLAASQTIGVLLPVCGFALDGRYADARALIDAGGAVALASNWNPGSAPSPSVAFAAALACRCMRMTPAEAITAITWNAACVLGVQHACGAIAPGYRADLILLQERDERALVYETPAALALRPA